MATSDVEKETQARRSRLKTEFSNHENSVTLIGSLEAWFDFRWGKKGKFGSGLLECFNRFPCDGLFTPDFEVRFHTPYTIWGECKRQVNSTYEGDVTQLLDYARRREIELPRAYDVVVLVRPENDNVAAKAISEARKALLEKHQVLELERIAREQAEIDAERTAKENEIQTLRTPGPMKPLELSGIVVLSYYLDRESINNEWYTLKWREEHDNSRCMTNPVFECRLFDFPRRFTSFSASFVFPSL